jgi:hypothetical protein
MCFSTEETYPAATNDDYHESTDDEVLRFLEKAFHAATNDNNFENMDDEIVSLLLSDSICVGPTRSEMDKLMTPRAETDQINWYRRLAELAAYKEINGDCNVPQKGSALGHWVNKQRGFKSKFDDGYPSPMAWSKIDALDDLGFDWGGRKKDPLWRKHFKEMVEFKSENGHCFVPTRGSKHSDLGRWVTEQRKEYKLYNSEKPTKLTKAKVDCLDEIQFVWNAQTARNKPRRKTNKKSGEIIPNQMDYIDEIDFVLVDDAEEIETRSFDDEPVRKNRRVSIDSSDKGC